MHWTWKLWGVFRHKNWFSTVLQKQIVKTKFLLWNLKIMGFFRGFFLNENWFLRVLQKKSKNQISSLNLENYVFFRVFSQWKLIFKSFAKENLKIKFLLWDVCWWPVIVTKCKTNFIQVGNIKSTQNELR